MITTVSGGTTFAYPKYLYEFPNEKLRNEVKAHCAMRGITMRDFFTEAVREKLIREGAL